MTERIWYSGPPPHVGWWNASFYRYKNCWRWWNGADWSLGTRAAFPGKEAAKWAAILSRRQHNIFWTDYWPENAHVPRIAP